MFVLTLLCFAIDYKNDPYAEKDAWDQVCARGDLSYTDRELWGCTDTKVGSMCF